MNDVEKNSNKFCCSSMKHDIEKQNNPDSSDICPNSVCYDPVFRDFWCYTKKGDTTPLGNAIYYCPFCGTKLPKSLIDEYDIELEKAVGRKEYEALFYYENEGLFKECPVLDRTKVPKEFQTDEWWIKRGL